MASEPVFQLRDVSYTYPNGVKAIQGLNAEVPAGCLTLVTGDNGSGKTTLLMLLDGLIFATEGQVLFKGTQLSEQLLESEDFGKAFRTEVGLMFQEPDVQLFNSTVREDIAYGPESLGLGGVDERVKRAGAGMELLGLLDRPPHALSWGQKKRVALATLLAGDYTVLLLDEPGVGLDSRARSLMLDAVERALCEGKTLVVVAHDDPDLSRLACHEIEMVPVGP